MKEIGGQTFARPNKAMPHERVAAAHEASWAAGLIERYVDWTTSRHRATRSFSLLRIIYGIGMLLFLVPSYADRAYIWGFASTWVDPENRRRGYPEIFQAMFPKDNPFVFDMSYWILIILVIVFLLGYKTKYVTPVLLLFWIGLQSNSMLVTNGGDTLYRITLSFLVFANLTSHWSVDAWLHRRRTTSTNHGNVRKNWFPACFGAGLHNTVLVLCCFQIMLVYVNSGIYKLMGKEWVDGTAFYYSLNLDAFQGNLLLAELAWQITPAVLVATWISVYFQLLFPVLLLWKYTRYVSLVLLLGMHLGIGLFLGLWPFSLAMIALDMLFVRDSSWEKLFGWLARASRIVRAAIRPENGSTATSRNASEEQNTVDEDPPIVDALRSKADAR